MNFNPSCGITSNSMLIDRTFQHAKPCRKSPISEIVTYGLGCTRFYFGSQSLTVPTKVVFEDGSFLSRSPQSYLWTTAKGSIEQPWAGQVLVYDSHAVIQAGAVTDLLKVDGAHLRYHGDKIVMIVTMAGDLFEFEYRGETLQQVKLDGKPYVQLQKRGWRLVNQRKAIYGIAMVNENGFTFDAETDHGYSDSYLTNGNLITMRNGISKLTFGFSRT